MLTVKARNLILAAALTSGFIPGCYQIPINQGNRIEQTAVERLKTGMTREQVRYLMGSPVLQEPFTQSRWNYVYRYKTKAGDYEERTIILHFKGDILAQMTGDMAAPEKSSEDAIEDETEEAPLL